MKTAKENFAVSALSLAVHGALAAMFAMPMAALAQGAADDEIAALTRPTNTVEIGVSNTSLDSAKFGEYSGLNKSGTDLIGNFSIRGGDGYGGGPGSTRWSLSGSDLGTTSRNLGASVSKQGQWNLGIGHDELRHNLSDTYQTYLQGSLGGNAFTAPPTFGVFNGNSAVLAASSRNLDATQRSLYHTEDVGTTRKNTSFSAGFNFSPQLSLQFDFNRLKQSGAKLSSSGALGGIATVTPAGSTFRAEAIAIYMNPTNYTTDNVNLSLNWIGDKGHLTGSYHGSSFSDGYDRVTWQNVQANAAAGICASGGACTYQTNTMSTAPDNKFHQWNLAGGYAISSATKLTGGLSYGRNTQNSGFLTGMPEIVAAPVSSLNGLVVTKHADVKLTHQATRDLAINAGLKINERDNRSSSNFYRYYALNNVTTAENATNAPYSNKKTEFELAGDYRFDKRHSVRLAYNHEKISRWCNSMANGFNNCVVSPSSKEDKLAIKYKLKATGDIGFNAGYSYAKRRAQFDHDAVTPLAGLDTNLVIANDVNAQDYPGFIAHIYASRKQQMLKAGVNWQATEQLDLGINGRYASDKYFESSLGVQDGRTKGLNLDATYTYSEENSVAAYVSWQNSKRNLRSGGAGGDNTAASAALLVAPTSIWTNQLTDDSTAFGINTKHSGLMGGKLELKGDVSYSLDKTGYATQLEYAAATCAATNLTACGPLPDISSKVFTLKLTGTYQVDKTSKVALGYIFQQRRTEDYYYNTLQFGNTPSRNMPTNEQAPNSSVNMIGASYIYSFK